MIAAITSDKQLRKITISTGNILNVNNKLGTTLNEELLDGLELTFNDDNVEICDAKIGKVVLRAAKELDNKLSENDRGAINIGAKIFLRENSCEYIRQAVFATLEILKTSYLDKLVLAYPIKIENQMNSDGVKENTIKSNARDGLRKMWSTLEEFAKQNHITQLGVADLDTETLSELHSKGCIPPSIVQINLVSCCKVPAEMQEFCTSHDIQILTHSDPQVIIPGDNEFIVPGYTVDWILRYQVHLRCRGLLIAKGFIIGASTLISQVIVD